MRVATCSVGLVSPRSTCESIGALTPQRSARSRSDRPIASRRARTRPPIVGDGGGVDVAHVRAYVITYSRIGRRRPITTIERMQRPDVLVLGAGGTVGAAWMGGVLAGIAAETGIDFAACEHIVGTSAGSMRRGRPARRRGAARAQARRERARPTERGRRDGAALRQRPADAGERRRKRTTARPREPARREPRERGRQLARPLALSLGRAPGALVRAAALARIEEPTGSLDDLGARIAGSRARAGTDSCASCASTARAGRRVVFGAPGAPAATVAEAVQASCSIPWVYRPVRIGERRLRRRRRLEPDEHGRRPRAARDARAVPRADGRAARRARAPSGRARGDEHRDPAGDAHAAAARRASSPSSSRSRPTRRSTRASPAVARDARLPQGRG